MQPLKIQRFLEASSNSFFLNLASYLLIEHHYAIRNVKAMSSVLQICILEWGYNYRIIRLQFLDSFSKVNSLTIY